MPIVIGYLITPLLLSICLFYHWHWNLALMATPYSAQIIAYTLISISLLWTGITLVSRYIKNRSSSERSDFPDLSPVTEKEKQRAWHAVDEACKASGHLRPFAINEAHYAPLGGALYPQVIVNNSPYVNAHAEENNTVHFNRGLLTLLCDKALQAVAKHEMSHIINKDSQNPTLFFLHYFNFMLFLLLGVGAAGSFFEVYGMLRSVISDGAPAAYGQDFLQELAKIDIFLGLVLVAFASTALLYFYVCRRLEFRADRDAATYEWQPSAVAKMARAFQKNSDMYPNNKKNFVKMLTSPFSTHPSHIKRRRAMHRLWRDNKAACIR